jgi:DMSO reductase family type II enzyme iron-sulfur subunit
MAINDIEKQVRMVFDLNKCIGCHTCTMACKTMWTDGRVDIPLDNLPDNPEGLLYQYWNNVETTFGGDNPSRGYPRGVFSPEMGGGFTNPKNPDDWTVDPLGPLPSIHEDYGDPWEYNYDQVLGSSAVEDQFPGKSMFFQATESQMVPTPAPDGPDAYASNWEEDVGAGDHPNTHYFYMPRLCNHCTKPACLAACPKNAIYKREEDGVVLIDQARCEGYRRCVSACPYKKIYYNAAKKKSQKCIFCYPRLEQDTGPNELQPPRENFCFNQCVGRIRFVGFYNPSLGPDHVDNQAKNVNKLVDGFTDNYSGDMIPGIALRLHPEYGTSPNLFYVPPLSPPKMNPDGSLVTDGSRRIPTEFLATMLGDNVNQTLDERYDRIEDIFTILEEQRAIVADGGSSELVDILVAREETDRLQLYLG